MCGIAGGIALEPGRALLEVVSTLTRRLARRGPDGEGLADLGDVALGHRRLAIIELTAAGAQPMADSTGRYVITFNGEIYNHAELRRELVSLGRVFATHSDTEVIIHALAQWGEAGLNRLRGMFAFALWDKHEQELWLARDPFGIKPLYVAERDGVLWFASQARALAEIALVDTARDPAALVGFYLWGHVPEPFTWWAGVRMFPAGHVQRIKRGAQVGVPRSFFSLAEALATPGPRLSLDDLGAELEGSMRRHLVADVPVGVFLSAGVDSGVLASLARPLCADLHTITLAFVEYEGRADDEAPAAEALAGSLGSQHATVRIDRDEFDSVRDDFLHSMDQPSIDGLNTYLVSRAAAQRGLKVMLSGLGADEMFGGYPSFTEIPKLLRLGSRIPMRTQLGRVLEGLRAIAPRRVPPKAFGLVSHAGRIEDAYLLRRALHLTGELDALLDESWLKAGFAALADNARAQALRDAAPPLSIHAQIVLLETTRYMRNQLLRDSDWASMAHGLELRVPFVDVGLFTAVAGAIAAGAPPTKSDLAEAAGLGWLARRPKTGFTTPVRSWIGAESARGLRGWASAVHGRFRTSAGTVAS